MAVDPLFYEQDWQNGFEASLDTRIVLTDTYIPMTPVPEKEFGRLVIEDTSRENFEVVRYNRKDASGVYIEPVNGGIRNQDGTSSGVHPRGARVRMNWTAQDFRDMQAALENIESQSISGYARDIGGNFILPGTGIATIQSGLTGRISDIQYYIGGVKYTVSGIANKLYTANRDTYVDIDIAGNITYTPVANNATAPALAVNNVRVAKYVTSGSGITVIWQNVPDGAGHWITPSHPIVSALDSGYRDLPLSSGITSDGSRTVKYKRVGDTVFVSGRFLKATGTFSSNDMGVLPVGFRPFGGNGDLTFVPGAASGYIYRSAVAGTTGIINSGTGNGGANFIDINISFRCE